MSRNYRNKDRPGKNRNKAYYGTIDKVNTKLRLNTLEKF